MEMFNAFGFADRVMKEAYWVNETTFWKPGESETRQIVRHGRIPDTEEGLSEFPHVILNQARVHPGLIEDHMGKFRQPFLGVGNAAMANDLPRFALAGLPEGGLIDPIGLLHHPVREAEGVEHLHGAPWRCSTPSASRTG